MKNDSALFYTCSLIEYIGRQQKQKRADVTRFLGAENLTHIYSYADVFHCEPIEKTAFEFTERFRIPEGSYDNITSCRYDVPDYWTIGEVYARLIEDVCPDRTGNTAEEVCPDRAANAAGDACGDVIQILIQVYCSWIDDAISNYNSDFFYQPREYIRECFRCGKVL